MHRSIREHLEQYLCGSGEWDGKPEFGAHLDGCRACRREVEAMEAQCGLLRLLAGPAEMEASPGFYAKVMSAVDTQRRHSVASEFLDPVFGRRLVYACLLSLLVLGSFLFYSVNSSATGGWNPMAVIAEGAASRHHIGDGGDPRQDREFVLVTLASYQE
jgi:anti-sigma factor RsiW